MSPLIKQTTEPSFRSHIEDFDYGHVWVNMWTILKYYKNIVVYLERELQLCFVDVGNELSLQSNTVAVQEAAAAGRVTRSTVYQW